MNQQEEGEEMELYKVELVLRRLAKKFKKTPQDRYEVAKDRRNVPLSLAYSFVYIALNNGTGTMKELSTLIGASQATISKHIQVFISFKMVDYKEDPNNRSIKLLYLLPDGLDFANELKEL